MRFDPNFIPASSQTVGPYFRIGLEYLIERASAVPLSRPVTMRGRVLDRDGAPVADAMLEFWSSACREEASHDAFPNGFRRVATDVDGAFSVALERPQSLMVEGGSSQAPHLLVLVFARGLLRQLITRVYFDDEAANVSDPVLITVPADRRDTLIARSHEKDSFRWDVILQGTHETVFFAW